MSGARAHERQRKTVNRQYNKEEVMRDRQCRSGMYRRQAAIRPRGPDVSNLTAKNGEERHDWKLELIDKQEHKQSGIRGRRIKRLVA